VVGGLGGDGGDHPRPGGIHRAGLDSIKKGIGFLMTPLSSD